MTDDMAFTDRDDALHPFDSEGYYEWWYFDAQLNNGYICALAAFWRRHTETGQPAIDITIYTPDGRVLHADEVFDPGACRASQDKCDVALGANYVRQDGADLYRVVVHVGKIGVDLLFRRRVPGWKVSASGLLIDDSTGKQGWINAIPRADVEGTLFVEGKKVPVRGLGYHDHNWGNTEMGKSFSGWVWGRAFDTKYTFVYGWLMPMQAGVAVKPFVYAATGNQPIFASSDTQLETIAEIRHEESGMTVPTEIRMSGKAPWGVEVDCHLTMTRLMAWTKSAQPSGKPVNYFRRLNRFVAEVSVGAMEERASGDAIDEYVLLR